MSSSPPPDVDHRWGGHPVRWLFIGLAIMFALIGAAIFIRLVVPGQYGPLGPPPAGDWPFGWFGGLFWLIVGLFVLWWFVRGMFWMTRGPWGRRRWDRHYGFDDAASIARERYARGEISRDQYDQLMKDLSGPRP